MVTGCSSPQTYKHLQSARYTFWVNAWGPGGVDSTPAVKRLTMP
jgi:hypothetical protein